MPDAHVDVILISLDRRLADLVGKHRPRHLRLRCICPPKTLGPLPPTATQLWLDLDDHAAPPTVDVQRRIYFHSRFDRRPAELPPGVFVRKPCSASIIELLWAGVERHEQHKASVSAQRPAADLPAWIHDLHLIDLKELCRLCVRELPGRLGFRHASLYLYDRQTNLLTLAETNHKRQIDLSVSLDRPRGRIMADVARSGRLLYCDDHPGKEECGLVLADPQKRSYPDRACLVTPLLCENELHGVLNFSGRETAAIRVERPRLEAIFAFIARSIDQARRYQRARNEARIDDLTGLANYRAFREALDRETKRSQRYGSPLSLAMLDLDGLKAVNDQFGHSAGDFLLRNMTSRITSALRQFDIPARVGGDEFAIILPNTNIDDARIVAVRMLERFRLDPPRFEQQPLAITGSCGIAPFSPARGPDALVTAADEALYDAKRQGRNRVVCRSAESGAATAQTARGP